MLGHQKWLLYLLCLCGVFVAFRASQFREDSALAWGPSLNRALSSFPYGPPGSEGKGSTAITQFGLNMMLVLPVLHFAKLQ